jgi:hypothetical protein
MTNEATRSKEMPKYRSHKVVHALKLADLWVSLDGNNPGCHATIVPDDPAFSMIAVLPGDHLVPLLAAAIDEHPSDPGYLVVYADGYRSWSPTAAFEEGYSIIQPPD